MFIQIISTYSWSTIHKVKANECCQQAHRMEHAFACKFAFVNISEKRTTLGRGVTTPFFCWYRAWLRRAVKEFLHNSKVCVQTII